MMRLALALAVLFSHAGLRIEGLNPGVSAVIGFYLISGYVMTGLVRRHFAAPEHIPAFYADRLIRILPQYLIYAGATLVWFHGVGAHTPFLARSPDALDLLNNLTVVPLNFYMFTGADQFTLIPPAWSLGAELQFYLLVPCMVLWPRVGLALVVVWLPPAGRGAMGLWGRYVAVCLAAQSACAGCTDGRGRAACGARHLHVAAPRWPACGALQPGGSDRLGPWAAAGALAVAAT